MKRERIRDSASDNACDNASDNARATSIRYHEDDGDDDDEDEDSLEFWSKRNALIVTVGTIR